MRKEKAMTIIATILTIIVLLILGTLTIYLLIGDMGLFLCSAEVGNVYEEDPINQVEQKNLLQNATNTTQDPIQNILKELEN